MKPSFFLTSIALAQSTLVLSLHSGTPIAVAITLAVLSPGTGAYAIPIPNLSELLFPLIKRQDPTPPAASLTPNATHHHHHHHNCGAAGSTTAINAADVSTNITSGTLGTCHDQHNGTTANAHASNNGTEHHSHNGTDMTGEKHHAHNQTLDSNGDASAANATANHRPHKQNCAASSTGAATATATMGTRATLVEELVERGQGCEGSEGVVDGVEGN